MLLTKYFLVFLFYFWFLSLTIGRAPVFQEQVTLFQCTEFCEGHNLPLHYSNEKKHCCCKEDLDPEPGYIVVWDEEPLLSQGKPSRQSSTFDPNHSSEKAFDGNLNQMEKPGGSCSLTNKETFPFIQVDLLQAAIIKSVRVYNGIGVQQSSFNNAPIEVRFNENSPNMKICAYILSITNENQIQTFYCEPNVIGRYVRLVNPDMILNICEMQVFGHYR